MAKQNNRPRFEDLPDVLSPHEAAQALGVADNTVRTLCKSGAIHARKTGDGQAIATRWLIPKRAVIDWLEGA